ncbi:MAG: hypothetical protein FWF29_08360, partial [Treponema sp.]|nr:hypothetical protein [Treponema sp.]
MNIFGLHSGKFIGIGAIFLVFVGLIACSTGQTSSLPPAAPVNTAGTVTFDGTNMIISWNA